MSRVRVGGCELTDPCGSQFEKRHSRHSGKNSPTQRGRGYLGVWRKTMM